MCILYKQRKSSQENQTAIFFINKPSVYEKKFFISFIF